MSGKTAKISRRNVQRSIQRGIRQGQQNFLVEAWRNTLREPLITRLKLAFWLIRGENKRKQIAVK